MVIKALDVNAISSNVKVLVLESPQKMVRRQPQSQEVKVTLFPLVSSMNIIFQRFVIQTTVKNDQFEGFHFQLFMTNKMLLHL